MLATRASELDPGSHRQPEIRYNAKSQLREEALGRVGKDGAGTVRDGLLGIGTDGEESDRAALWKGGRGELIFSGSSPERGSRGWRRRYWVQAASAAAVSDTAIPVLAIAVRRTVPGKKMAVITVRLT